MTKTLIKINNKIFTLKNIYNSYQFEKDFKHSIWNEYAIMLTDCDGYMTFENIGTMDFKKVKEFIKYLELNWL